MNSYNLSPASAQGQPCYGCGDGGYMQTPSMNTTQGMNMQNQLPTGLPSGPTVSTPLYPAVGTLPAQQRATMPQQGTMAAQQGNMTTQQGTMTTPSVVPTNLNPSELAPITALNQPLPMTTQSLQYINGFLRTQVGKRVTVDFLIGTGTLTDRTGTLLGVGANYIVLNEVETDDILVCDFYSIKFVRVYL